jgi:hypothetical protein
MENKLAGDYLYGMDEVTLKRYEVHAPFIHAK